MSFPATERRGGAGLVGSGVESAASAADVSVSEASVAGVSESAASAAGVSVSEASAEGVADASTLDGLVIGSIVL